MRALFAVAELLVHSHSHDISMGNGNLEFPFQKFPLCRPLAQSERLTPWEWCSSCYCGWLWCDVTAYTPTPSPTPSTDRCPDAIHWSCESCGCTGPAVAALQ